MTWSPVKGQPEGAKGKQVLGTPTGPLVPQIMPISDEQSLSIVHPSAAVVRGYMSENTVSYVFPVVATTQTVLPDFPSSVRGTPAETGHRAGVFPAGAFTHVVAPLNGGALYPFFT